MDDPTREPGGQFDYRLRVGECWMPRDDGSILAFVKNPNRMLRIDRAGRVWPFIPPCDFRAGVTLGAESPFPPAPTGG